MLELGLKIWLGFHKVETLTEALQSKAVVAKDTANCTRKGKCQQSRLESWVKRGDVRELGGKDELKALKFCPEKMKNY